MVYVLYIYDWILNGPYKYEADQVIQDIQNEKLNITIERYFKYFLVININIRQDGSIHLIQPHLIDQILEDIKMGKLLSWNKHLHQSPDCYHATLIIYTLTNHLTIDQLLANCIIWKREVGVTSPTYQNGETLNLK